MYSKKINTFSLIFFLVFSARALNLFKMFMLGKGFLYSLELSNDFLFILGVTLPIYSIFESTFQAGIIPFFKDLERKKESLLSIILIIIIFSFLISGLFIYNLSFPRSSDLKIFFILFLLLSGSIFKIFLEAQGKFIENYSIDLIISIFFIFGMFLRINLLSLFLTLEFFRYITKILFLIPYLKDQNFIVSNGNIKPILKNCLIIFPGSFFSNIRGSIEYFFISGIYLGSYVLNFGSFIISGILGVMNISLSGFLLKNISENTKDKERLKKYRDFIFLNILPFSFLIFFFLFIKGRHIVVLFIKNGENSNLISDISTLIKLNSLLIPLFIIQLYFIRFFNSIKKNLFLTIVSFIEICFNVFLLYRFIPSYGITIVPLARLLSMVVSIFFMLFKFKEKRSLFLYSIFYVKKIHILIIFFILIYLFNIYINVLCLILFFILKRDYYVRFYRSIFKKTF